MLWIYTPPNKKVLYHNYNNYAKEVFRGEVRHMDGTLKRNLPCDAFMKKSANGFM